MLLAKAEFKNTTVERIADYITDTTEQGFRVWLYEKKVYAFFKVASTSVLKGLTARLKRVKNLEFRFFRIEEVSV